MPRISSIVPDQANGRITLRHELPLLDVRAGDEGNAAMRVDVVRPVLCVILDDEDQGRCGVRAVRYFVDDEPHRVIIVGDLQFWSVDPADRLCECPSMVVHQAQQSQIGQVLVVDKLIEFTRPFDITEKIR